VDFQQFFDKKIMPIMGAIGSQRHILAIRDGVVINLIPSIIGSLFLLIAALPIPGYDDYIRKIGLFDALLIPIGATMGLMGVIALIAVSYRLAESYKKDALAASIIAISSFFMLTPYTMQHALVTDGIKDIIPTVYLGSGGLFTALIVALVSTEIYVKLVNTNITIKMPDGVPPAVARSFAALIPGGVTLIIFWLIRLAIDYSAFDNVHTIVADLMTRPLTNIGDTLGGAIVFMFLVHFFWFFGIHGHLVIGGILDPIFLLLQDQNRIAFQVGEAIPHIITRYWFDLYVTFGGSGATLPVVIALVFFARSKHLKGIGNLSLAPGLFNINEPFVFGMPIVFNPILFIPWILAPIVNICSAYFATIVGFLPRHSGIIAPWTTPIFINGFLIAGWRGVVMQAINFILSATIWYAFIKKLDNIEYQNEIDSLKKTL